MFFREKIDIFLSATVRIEIIAYAFCLFSITNASCSESHKTIKETTKEILLQDSVLLFFSSPKDSLQRRAARFLFKNIKYHYSVCGEIINNYNDSLIVINSKDSYKERIDTYNAFIRNHDISTDSLYYLYDIDNMSANYIINNIEHAFKKWKEGKWATHLSFEDFCEYLLPYRVGNEPIEDWRNECEGDYLHQIDWMDSEDDKANSTYWAALNINEIIKKQERNIQNILHIAGTDFPYHVLKSLKIGECMDYALYTTYVMRSCGIPVSIDFTPQWPFRSNGHYWNTLLDCSGKNIPFMGGGSNPGYPCKAGYLMAKVFRKTFAYQEKSLSSINKNINEEIPPSLDDPFIKDVTTEYLKGTEISVKINNNILDKHFVYLSVFDNSDWIPICFSELSDKKYATFKDVGTGIAYLPFFWTAKGVVPAGCPIIAEKNGQKVKLIPNMTETQTIVMERKFPIFSGVKKYGERMYKGQFHASNDRNFGKFSKCGKIEHVPHMKYDSLKITSKGKFRYWRYLSPTNGFCNVAEIKFFSQEEQIPIKAIYSDRRNADGFSPEMAFDDDELTYYESIDDKGNWIGVDFGKPVQVEKILFIPRNDDNNITIGHLYQLDYYNKKGNVEIGGRTIAKERKIKFEGIPTNALYILHDLTKGKEERVFTYKDGKISWY